MTRIAPPHRTSTRTDRGAVIPLAALLLTAMIGMTAFAIDLGRLRTERRDLQAIADAIAFDAVQAIRGSADDSQALTLAIAEANQAAIRNDYDEVLTANEISVGVWDVANQELRATNALLDEVPTAVQVDLTSSVPMYFDLSSDERSVSRTAVAVAVGQAQAEVGSVLTGIQNYDPLAGCDANREIDQQLSFLNNIISSTLGIDQPVTRPEDLVAPTCDVTGPNDGMQLDLVSYQGLAAARVSLPGLAAELGFANADEMMAANVAADDLFAATAEALRNDNSSVNVDFADETMDDISEAQPTPSRNVDMSEVAEGSGANSGTYSAGAADATISVLDLLVFSAMAIDGQGFFTVDLPVNIPYVGGTVTPRISIIEPPKADGFKFAGQSGPSTSQIKIGLEIPLTAVELDFAVLGGNLAPLGTLTTSGTLGLVIEAASADTFYESIRCDITSTADGAEVDLRVDTNAVTVSLGSTTDGQLQQPLDAAISPLSILDQNFGLPGGPSINLADVTNIEETVTYAAGQALPGGYETNLAAGAGALGASETRTFSGPKPTDWQRYDGGLSATGVTTDIFGAADWNAPNQLLNDLGVTYSDIDNFIDDALQPIIDELPDELIDPLLTSLGFAVGGADARINDVRCQVPALANRG